LGPSKDSWCEFHKGCGHDVERCIALGYQLAGLVNDEFLKEYLEGNQEGVEPSRVQCFEESKSFEGC